MDGNVRILIRQTVWLGTLLGLSALLSFFFPFYVALLIIIGNFIAVNYLGKRVTKELRAYSASFETNHVNYHCMACGTRHRTASCPKCGSKMKCLDQETKHQTDTEEYILLSSNRSYLSEVGFQVCNYAGVVEANIVWELRRTLHAHPLFEFTLF